jgi:hypothetical protein
MMPFMDSNQLLDMSLDDLYLELGRQLAPSEGFGGDDWRLLSGRAQNWMRENREQLRLRICPNVGDADTVIEFSTLADSLNVMLHQQTAFVVAAIILKLGIVAFCRDFHG